MPGKPLHFQRGFAHIATLAGVNLQPITITCEPITLTKGEPSYKIPDLARAFGSKSGTRSTPNDFWVLPPNHVRGARANWRRTWSRTTAEGYCMADLERELKELIVSSLNLEDIAPEDIDSGEPLFEKGLGLDSIDGLELGMAIRKKYGIKVQGSKEEIRAIFETVSSIARYLAGQKSH